MKSTVLLLIGLVAVVSFPQQGHAQARLSPLIPPQSHAFGMPVDQWNVLQVHWALEFQLAGHTDPDTNPNTVGRVRFLPVDVLANQGVFHVTLKAGRAFALPPFVVYGEHYDNPSVPDDDPEDAGFAAFLEQIFADANISTTLDGRTLLQGYAAELESFMFGPSWFDAPIVYKEPLPRGENLNAIAALWAMGIGSVYRPLPVGEHELTYHVKTSFFGNFDNTYHIRVVP